MGAVRCWIVRSDPVAGCLLESPELETALGLANLRFARVDDRCSRRAMASGEDSPGALESSDLLDGGFGTGRGGRAGPGTRAFERGVAGARRPQPLVVSNRPCHRTGVAIGHMDGYATPKTSPIVGSGGPRVFGPYRARSFMGRCSEGVCPRLRSVRPSVWDVLGPWFRSATMGQTCGLEMFEAKGLEHRSRGQRPRDPRLQRLTRPERAKHHQSHRCRSSNATWYFSRIRRNSSWNVSTR